MNAELIAELRGHILSVPLTLLHDAADALEELQQIADHYEQTAKDYWKEARDYKQRIAELEAVDVARQRRTADFGLIRCADDCD